MLVKPAERTRKIIPGEKWSVQKKHDRSVSLPRCPEEDCRCRIRRQGLYKLRYQFKANLSELNDLRRIRRRIKFRHLTLSARQAGETP